MKAPRRTLTLGHSPDADDAFMFWGLATNTVPTDGLRFRHILKDIQTLNERARHRELDVTAISAAAYPHVARHYAILSCGASLGDGYGPIVVARKRIPRRKLATARIAVPGEMTSAFLALRLCLGDFPYVVVPFDKIFAALKKDRADAGLLIHEGQLTYREEGFEKILDLGRWWKEQTGLPLPLGINVVRRDLGMSVCRKVNRILRESIRYGLKHRLAALAHARRFGRGLDRRRADRFVGMYVNRFTLDLGARGRRGVREFLWQGATAGLIPPLRALEFVR